MSDDKYKMIRERKKKTLNKSFKLETPIRGNFKKFFRCVK